MNWPYTSSKEINKIIDSLKSKNSSGSDEIPTNIIKISKPFLISPTIKICNKILAQGIYPERLKFPLNGPIYKSGDKSVASNYKPISLLSVFSKLFEKVIYNRLFDHLPYFPAYSAHLTYNAHPKLFCIPFEVQITHT
jgi:hypothetical protein